MPAFFCFVLITSHEGVVVMHVSTTTPVVTCTSFPTISIPRPFSPPSEPAMLFAKVALPSMLISEDQATTAPEGTIYEVKCVDGWFRI